MGKPDPKQPKLAFENKRLTRAGDAGSKPEGEPSQAGDKPDEDLRAIMLEVRSNLRAMDTKLEALTTGLDMVKRQVNTHESRLDALENRAGEAHEYQVD